MASPAWFCGLVGPLEEVAPCDIGPQALGKSLHIFPSSWTGEHRAQLVQRRDTCKPKQTES